MEEIQRCETCGNRFSDIVGCVCDYGSSPMTSHCMNCGTFNECCNLDVKSNCCMTCIEDKDIMTNCVCCAKGGIACRMVQNIYSEQLSFMCLTCKQKMTQKHKGLQQKK
jgi:hypothetical protein